MFSGTTIGIRMSRATGQPEAGPEAPIWYDMVVVCLGIHSSTHDPRSLTSHELLAYTTL